MKKQPAPALCDKEPSRVPHENTPLNEARPFPDIGMKGRVPRILLAEDDPAIRDVLGLMLTWMNYDLDFAEDGLKAVELWEKGGYDLVLMDVQMPRLDGFAATRAIRKKEGERGGHTPIVAMTAHARKEDEERCLAAGMDCHISKPIDFEKSLQVIGNIFAQMSGGMATFTSLPSEGT
ncbi:response regulator [Geobacter sp. AOG1]|uniref:response regulator n=1 Tax=Geobacter sp. AOG1 TaxID=1566346 RepID=UPI001CC59E02|nr:response regulator [Geobacter sp. AOG1]GFE56268.1 hypothetical protein AOG1_01460 [Geobacter sp. AOG1]